MASLTKIQLAKLMVGKTKTKRKLPEWHVPEENRIALGILEILILGIYFFGKGVGCLHGGHKQWNIYIYILLLKV